ncbi:hypothetical protein MKX40_22210 [Paenibacillus sp. FSL R5-0517]|uniref:hypothetical protein n=1 Tax=Paenibacillus sp. FSL R5-0517 TaxID=2921647 RepID=UPI0030D9C742
MSKNTKFLEQSNWSLIKRGWVFEAVVPFAGERPLDFFIPDQRNSYRGRKHSISQTGTSVALSENFETGQSEFEIVLKVKRRKVVIISSDDLNGDNSHDDVIVAKIYSIKEHEKDEEWYHLTKAGTHPLFAYLPDAVTGKECYVDLSNTTTIHKNMLLDEKYDITEFMDIIEQRIEYCYQMGVYKKISQINKEDIS